MYLLLASHKGLEERNLPVEGMRTGAGIRYGREPAVRDGVRGLLSRSAGDKAVVNRGSNRCL